MTSKVVKALLEGWDIECVQDNGKRLRQELGSLFGRNNGKSIRGSIEGREAFITLLEGTFKFWAETSPRRDQSHVMVTLKGRFNG